MSQWRGRTKPAFFTLFGLLCVGATGAALKAQDSSAAAPSATSTQSVYLDYRELSFNVGNWGIPMTVQSAPFKKEPDLGQRKVYRGTLKFGDSTEAFVPFIWDQAQGKLYLDLNRNQDLTDDADGVFACQGPPNYSFQNFGRVRLRFKTPVGTERLAVGLFFNEFRGTLNASATPYFCWEAKVTQGGQDWQVALVDSLVGKLGSAQTSSLIIRPWADRGKAIDSLYGSLDSLPFTGNVFFGQRACHLDCALVQQDNNLKYRLNLTERPEQLGELRITGQYIHRLVLTRRFSVAAQAPSLTVILDSPGPVVKVPVGSYAYQLSLKQGGTEASLMLNYASVEVDSEGRSVPRLANDHGLLVVSAANAATLAAGGPLTNSVTVDRRGRSLALNYRLLGANGEAYQLQGVRKEPEFAIYRAGKSRDTKLASGRFQFG